MSFSIADGAGEGRGPAEGVEADDVEGLGLVEASLGADELSGAGGGVVGDSCHIINFIQNQANIRETIIPTSEKSLKLRVDGSLQLQLFRCCPLPESRRCLRRPLHFHIVLLLVSHALFTRLQRVYHIALPLRCLRPLHQLLLFLGETRVDQDLGTRLLLALRALLRFFVKAIVRCGAKLPVDLLGGALEVGGVLGSSRVGFAVEKEVGIDLYLFFNEVMERLGFGVEAGLVRVLGVVVFGVRGLLARVHGVEEIVVVELAGVGGFGKFAHERQIIIKLSMPCQYALSIKSPLRCLFPSSPAPSSPSST